MNFVKEEDEEGHVYNVMGVKKALGFLCNLIDLELREIN